MSARGPSSPWWRAGRPSAPSACSAGRSAAPLSPAEVDTAIEIGLRAGLALHHARLFGQQRDLADALQRSMLTDPPEPDHSHIVVRYVPAAAGAEIGGDWYDAFLQPGGATVIAIGDVVGHDTRAAAAMGQVRGLLRGIGYSSGGSPAEVLTELDRAIEGLALDTMATALVARLEQDEDDLRAGRVLLRWSSAGHPPPAGADRRRQGHAPRRASSPSCCSASRPRPSAGSTSPSSSAGSTVLLYTDGLVERRDRDLDAGTAELVEVLRECADLPLDDLCDEVLKRLFLPDAQDDVAMLGRPAAPAGRAAPGGGRSPGGPAEHRARARRDARGRHRHLSYGRCRRRPSRSRVRPGRSTATGASQPRQTDSTRSAATSTMTEAATGSGSSPSRPGEHGQRGRPDERGDGVVGAGLHDVGALRQQDVADDRAAHRGQRADEDHRRAGQPGQLGLLGADHGEEARA